MSLPQNASVLRAERRPVERGRFALRKRFSSSANVPTQQMPLMPKPSRVICIRNFHTDATKEDLIRILGDIRIQLIQIHPPTQVDFPFGKAMITFFSITEAAEGLSILNGRELHQTILDCDFFERDENEFLASRAIKVKKIPHSITRDQLMQCFCLYGDIQSTRSQLGLDAWNCIIEYDSFDSAHAALQAMNHTVLIEGGSPICVTYVEEARPGFLEEPSGRTRLKRGSFGSQNAIERFGFA